MRDTHDFIEKYLAPYLSECRIQNPLIEIETEQSVPPTGQEVEELVCYLLSYNSDPVIKHLHLTARAIKARTFRLASRLELFIARKLPHPLIGRNRKESSQKVVS